MTRNLKVLSLALIMAFGMSALAVSTAQAATDPLELTAEQYPVALTGEQAAHGETPGHKFETSGGSSFTCETVKFRSTVTENSRTEITVDPTIHGCRANPGNLKITVTMTHCDYNFHGGNSDGTHTFKEITVDLKCPEGVTAPHLEIWFNDANHAASQAPNCQLTPTPFTNKGGVTVHNVTGEPKDYILFTATVEGIHVHRTGSILCGAATQTAIYYGNTIIKGYEDLETTKNETSTIEFKEGNQIGVTLSDPTP